MYGCMDVCMSELKHSSSPLTVLQGDPELKVTVVGGCLGRGWILQAMPEPEYGHMNIGS